MRERIDDSVEIMNDIFSNFQNIDKIQIVGLAGEHNKEIALVETFEKTNKILVLLIFISMLTLQIVWVI